MEHADARSGLDSPKSDQTTLREFWFRIKEQEPEKSISERMALFESLLTSRDLWEYYNKKARESYCEALEASNRPAPSRRPFNPRPAVDTIKSTLYRTLFSLELVMPNGKQLRDCAGAEVGQWGSQFFRLARAIGPEQTVGAVFDTDEKLREFLG